MEIEEISSENEDEDEDALFDPLNSLPPSTRAPSPVASLGSEIEIESENNVDHHAAYAA
jgi:hypothetical protein